MRVSQCCHFIFKSVWVLLKCTRSPDVYKNILHLQLPAFYILKWQFLCFSLLHCEYGFEVL